MIICIHVFYSFLSSKSTVMNFSFVKMIKFNLCNALSANYLLKYITLYLTTCIYVVR